MTDRRHAREGDIAGDGTLGLGTAMALDARLRSGRLDMNALLEAFGLKPVKGGRMQVSTAKAALPDGPLALSMTADASASAVPGSLHKTDTKALLPG